MNSPNSTKTTPGKLITSIYNVIDIAGLEGRLEFLRRADGHQSDFSQFIDHKEKYYHLKLGTFDYHEGGSTEVNIDGSVSPRERSFNNVERLVQEINKNWGVALFFAGFDLLEEYNKWKTASTAGEPVDSGSRTVPQWPDWLLEYIETASEIKDRLEQRVIAVRAARKSYTATAGNKPTPKDERAFLTDTIRVVLEDSWLTSTPLAPARSDDKIQWQKVVNDPSAADDDDKSTLWQGALDVASVAAFAIPEGGVAVSAGLTAAQLILGGSAQENSQSAYVSSIVKQVGDDFRGVKTDDKLVEILNHFDKLSKVLINYNQQTAADPSSPLVAPRNAELIETLDHWFMDSSKTNDYLNLIDSNDQWVVPTDLGMPPPFSIVAMDVWCYCVSTWITAQKAAAILKCSSPNPTLDDIKNSEGSMEHVANIHDSVPKFIKSAESKLNRIEWTFHKRMARIRPVWTNFPAGSLAFAKTEDFWVVTVIDDYLEEDLFPATLIPAGSKDLLDKIGDSFADFGNSVYDLFSGKDTHIETHAEEYKHQVVHSGGSLEELIKPEVVYGGATRSDGLAWWCKIARLYGKRWHYIRNVNGTLVALPDTLATLKKNWQQTYDVFSKLY